ncbi:hypothetical protein ACTFIW_009997 [Dictyostelium discoideum]
MDIIESVKIQKASDIKRILQNNQELLNEVKDTQGIFFKISIPEIMKKLKISVDLVKVSYAASYGFPCSTNILEIILEFQNFIKTCNETCTVFVLKSIQGLNLIKNGLIEAKEGDFDYAIKLIRSTSKIADIMANEAKNMSILAKNLAEKSSNTLLIANHNRNEVVGIEKKENGKKNDLEVKKDILKSDIDSIDQSNYKLESEFLKQKAELQEKEIKSKSELAGKLKELELLVHTKNDLETSLACMDITIRTLGDIETSFNNVSHFWFKIKMQCENLFDKEQIDLALSSGDMEQKKRRIIQQFSESGLNWLSIAHMNIQALDHMEQVNNGVDNVVSNLPTREEAKIIATECCRRLSEQLKFESKEVPRQTQGQIEN